MADDIERKESLRERQEAYRINRRIAGQRRLELWVTPEQGELVKAYLRQLENEGEK